MRIIEISKVNTFLVGIMMLVILLCCSSQVQASQDGDYTYTLTYSKAQITGYTGSGGNVTVPSTLGGFPVTSIGYMAFYGSTRLTSISIPDGVTSIGEEAFLACKSLASINIPQGVTSIGDMAFSGCIGLTNITVNSATTTIYDNPSTISDSAKIIGYDLSTAQIYATKYNRTFVDITAPITLQSIAITTPATKLSYTVGNTLDLTGLVVTGTYSDGSTKSESMTASNVTGFNSGTAKVDQVLTITDGSKTTTFKVQILTAPITLQSIAITTPATKLSYTVGDKLDLTGLVVTGTYSDGSTKSESITATNITGFDSGTAVVDQVLTITVGSKTTTYKVQIVAEPITPTGISLNKNVTTINVGANETITATIDPTTATNQNVTWKSSNTAVATVDSNGKVVGVSAGTAIITVTTMDGSKTASCTVTVSNPINVTSVKLNKTSTNIIVGANETLSAIITATLAPTNNISIKVTWKSSNTAVATVDSSGNIVGIKAGTAVITVTTVDGSKKATCAVKVSDLVNVTGISLNKSSAELNVGANYTLIPTIAKTATTKGVAWKSSDTTIATVDANGKVVGASVGTATITVTSLDGSKTATCTLTVSIPVTKVSLNKSSSAVIVGANDSLTATIIPTNATLKDVTWKSSNTAVATVDSSGKIVGVKVGTSVITATANDGSQKKASCTVTVSTPKILVTGVTLNESSFSIKVSANETLIATIAPTNATNTKVTWKSSNTAVATVDSNGKVKGIKVGTAIITVSSQEGSKTDNCTVTVSISEL